jgi:hypothetical protein
VHVDVKIYDSPLELGSRVEDGVYGVNYSWNRVIKLGIRYAS